MTVAAAIAIIAAAPSFTEVAADLPPLLPGERWVLERRPVRAESACIAMLDAKQEPIGQALFDPLPNKSVRHPTLAALVEGMGK